MSHNIIVRKAQSEDIPAIYDITQDAFGKYQRELGLPGKVSALLETHEDIAHDIDTKHVLVATVDGIPQGSVRFEVFGDVSYLSRFGVHESNRKNGLGPLLIQAVAENSRALGVKAVALHTSARMSNLVRFYYKEGYFIHSTSFDRGYVRALFIQELCDDREYDLAPVMNK